MDQIKENILVIDDEPEICRLVARVLENEGYNPIVCAHPFDALKISEIRSFGLAFVDINLPEMSGLDLAEKLKSHDPMREMVFITGHGSFDVAIQAIKIGAYDYLRKPFSISEIHLCLKRYQERQALKEKIRHSEQRYFDLVQHIPLIIFELDRNFELGFINSASELIFGFDPKEAVNRKNWFLDRIHEEDFVRVKNLLHAAFEKGGFPYSIGCRFVHKKGHLIHTIIKSIPHSSNDASTPIELLQGIVVDISDRVFLEKAVVQKEKLKTLGAISAEVAHEIRNPLMAIGGFAKRLQKKSPELKECEIILKESDRLENILDRISNYLKPVEPCQQECSVNEILTDSLYLLSPETDRRRIHFSLDLDPALSMTFTDSEILMQVFINLIRYGIRALEESSNFFIKTYMSNRNIHIDFENPISGKKIKDPELLFLPFDEGGQSIGLPLCYRLVKNLGGVLSFTQDKAKMAFTVTLPLGKRQISEHLAEII